MTPQAGDALPVLAILGMLWLACGVAGAVVAMTLIVTGIYRRPVDPQAVYRGVARVPASSRAGEDTEVL